MSHHRLCLSVLFFFFNDTATTEIYTLSLHDALPILRIDEFFECAFALAVRRRQAVVADKRTEAVLETVPHLPHERSEEHTSELQSQSNLVCRLLLEKKKKIKTEHTIHVKQTPTRT